MIRTFVFLAVTAATVYGGFQAIGSMVHSAELAAERMQVVEQAVNGR